MPVLSQLNVYQIFILLFVISFSSFILSLGYTLYYWYHESKVNKKSVTDPRGAAVNEAMNIIENARSSAMQFLQEAQQEAQQILHGSEEVHTSTKEMFEKKLQEIGGRQMQTFNNLTQDLVQSYTSVLSLEKETSLKSIMDVSDALKQELSTEVHSFADSIKNVTAETESTIRNDVTNQYTQIENEMNNLANNIKNITKEAEEKMRSNLGGQYDVVQNEIAGLSESIKGVTAEAISLIKNNLAGESNEVKNVIHNFSETLKKAALDTEVLLRQEVKNEYQKVREELASYKQGRLEKIDNALSGMLEEVARDVLGKTMSMKDHEEMIMKSLESIKKSANLKEL